MTSSWKIVFRIYIYESKTLKVLIYSEFMFFVAEEPLGTIRKRKRLKVKQDAKIEYFKRKLLPPY